MQINLRIAIWNANGLSNHTQEAEIFLHTNYIDIFLISETHFTSRSYFRIRGYDLITANHPGNRAHAGAAILIKSSIKYEVLEEFNLPTIQAAGIKINCDNDAISIYSIYSPPRHNIECQDYFNFFKNLGTRFIVGGDYNAKHTWWGSRILNPKGRELYKCVQKYHYSVLSTGRPTYWPSDINKIPDLLDFVVYKGISTRCLNIRDSDELSSDHSPIILNFCTVLQTIQKTINILSPKTDLEAFKYWIDKNVNLNYPINNGTELDSAVENFTNLIHEAGALSTPVVETAGNDRNRVVISAEIQALIRNRRRLRRIWQSSRSPIDKQIFNRASSQVKTRIREFKNEETANFLKSLNINVSKNDEHCLWNATKYIKRPIKRNIPIKDINGSWCRSDKNKADAYSNYLENIFQSFNFNSDADVKEIEEFLCCPCQMDFPIPHIPPQEVQKEIVMLNNKKTPGYDRITATVAKSLPKKGILFLTLIFNSILRLQNFPNQWKYAEVIMVPKPSKPENVVSSYRPISLLTTFSKLFERIFLRRLIPILERKSIIPEHQFGFRQHHGTPEQCHRILNVIRDSLERKQYCSAVFLDIQQAFDRVWHQGILFKLKKLLPAPYYLFFKSYLEKRFFYVKVNSEMSDICSIKAGIPQGSVLGPVLYTIFTYDMPTNENVTVATYADDTALVAANDSPTIASEIIQQQLNDIEGWLRKWNIKVNTDKSTHITFTLRRQDCPAVALNGTVIPKRTTVKYLGLHLDRRNTWKKHIQSKREQLKIKTRKMYWLLGSKSELSLENKLLLYKTILKPVWTYGIQLWGTASNSNIEILQRYQSKTLRLIANAPWFITNNNIHKDLQIPTVKDEINKHTSRYLDRLSTHSNPLAICLLDETEEVNRLKRFHILDLPYRK